MRGSSHKRVRSVCPNPRHHVRSRERTAVHALHWAGLDAADATSVIARRLDGTAPRGPNRGSIPQTPVSTDMLAPRRRHHGPSQDTAWSTMGQWTDDEVGVDPADCGDAIPSRPTRCRAGGEYDARAHGRVPFRRWPDRDPWLWQLLATVPPCTRRTQSQDRNAGITAGAIRPLLQAGKESTGTHESGVWVISASAVASRTRKQIRLSSQTASPGGTD